MSEGSGSGAPIGTVAAAFAGIGEGTDEGGRYVDANGSGAAEGAVDTPPALSRSTSPGSTVVMSALRMLQQSIGGSSGGGSGARGGAGGQVSRILKYTFPLSRHTCVGGWMLRRFIIMYAVLVLC